MIYLIFILPALILSFYAQFKVKSTFSKYSKVRSARAYTGADVATAILRRNGMSGQVAVEAVAGSLSDHYDPSARTVRLSEDVYGSNSIAAIGVAAHEVGHAIQHNLQYGPLELRHKMVPVTNFASSASFPILLLGFFLQISDLIFVGIILFSSVVLFHVVTLPVEFNASRRAVVQLAETGLVSDEEVPMVKKVLGAAALTYVAAALSAIANLLYYLLIFMGSGDD
ncbi:MAG: zinc metallopeptidase [Syntrophomonas sp.]|uniref:zinc metallopeptidase n=1 Tax=Syntrophomonas sp. TaxID=2053627 RepID=UPI0026277F87|nr:zinc metallopeptidase [Syntrophomonas sp.]MDD2509729.1 zinc metallopeptidase [Syntrophomonas sp.]MDD3879079.1 zinc metallopeptidase [Syntrophomonas sp.]MDD4625861.1 zinc metallopeptidase [Syntrophomonas sp.]